MTNLNGDIDVQEPDNKIPGPASSTPRPDDLDKRLWKLLQKYFDKYNPYDGEAEQTIAAIKEAFADEGYNLTYIKGKPITELMFSDGTYLLSGKEWLKRFEAEFKMIEPAMRMLHETRLDVEEAAKRASGLL